VRTIQDAWDEMSTDDYMLGSLMWLLTEHAVEGGIASYWEAQ
jgi:hypothetical protein